MLTFTNNLNTIIDEAYVTLIKSNANDIVEENIWKIDVIKLSTLIKGDIRKFVHESCHTEISKDVVYFKNPTLKEIIQFINVLETLSTIDFHIL